MFVDHAFQRTKEYSGKKETVEAAGFGLDVHIPSEHIRILHNLDPRVYRHVKSLPRVGLGG
jgi:hypothetical protein